MSKRLLLLPLVAVLVLGGCVSVPTGPAVTVMPGSQKSFDQFRADDNDCREYSQAQVGGPDGARAANDAAASNATAGTLIGAAAGAIIGAATGQAGHGAAIGAGTGLLIGSSAGSNSAAYSSRSLQRSYDVAYMQCMYSRGHQVPGRVAYRGSGPYYAPQNAPAAPAPHAPPPGYYPPPNYPPPNYPPPNYPPPG